VHHPPTPSISPPSLHDALPISPSPPHRPSGTVRQRTRRLAYQETSTSSVCAVAAESSASSSGSSASIRPSLCLIFSSISSARPRSAEHTSELQSRFDLVCRLLL